MRDSVVDASSGVVSPGAAVRAARGAAALFDPDELAARGDRTALVDDGCEISYADLADRVRRRRDELGGSAARDRRLVIVEVAPTVDFVVSLLGCFAGRHPVALAGSSERLAALGAAYRPDVEVIRTPGGELTRHAESGHELHDDLALLLSTSGSTSAPKLVRLSSGNVMANAASIAASLGLDADDRGITALPLHYCYGLSVLTSHLAVGASVVLTRAGIVDPCFADVVERHGVTGIAAVPHSFDLLRASDRRVLAAPSLRYVTQAGGRLAPDDVEHWAEVGRDLGWDLRVMYGQTEATARMACSAPGESGRRPGTVGVAVPGGSFRIDHSVGPDGVGEIVYRGPNVMMGYATTPADLAAGAGPSELRTGDLGRLDEDGVLTVTGRLRRFVKIHGRRVDLDDLERGLVERLDAEPPASLAGPDHPRLHVAGDDESIAVWAEFAASTSNRPTADDDLAELVTRLTELPRGRVVAVVGGEVPRTASGKVDAPELLAAARSVGGRVQPGGATPSTGDDTVAAVYALVLGRAEVGGTDSFASLGGDSFSYVEASIRLERLLGTLPTGWHLLPVGQLEGMRTAAAGSGGAAVGDAGGRRRWVRVESSVVIRAVAIALIVCTHMRLYRLPGGAHTLLVVLGFNFARFQLVPAAVGDRARRAVATVARVAAPTSAWIGINMLVAGGYSLGALLLVNNYTGAAARRGGRWEYWYFEAFAQTMIVLAVVFSIGAVRRAERRAPFVFALGVLAATLVVRFDVVQWGGEYNEMFRTHTVACFVALGWCAQRARSVAQRLAVSALAVVTTVGYFGQTDREWRIIAATLALVWIPTLRLPSRVAALVATVAAASMWIFLVHWQVWPLFTRLFERHVAWAATMAFGVGVWWCAERIRLRWRPRASDESIVQRLRRVLGLSTRSHVSAPDTTTRTSDARPVAA